MDQEITIKKERIIEAAHNCPTADNILRIMFPEVFADEKYAIKNIPNEGLADNNLRLACDAMGLKYNTLQVLYNPIGSDNGKGFFFSGQDYDWEFEPANGGLKVIPIIKKDLPF